MRRATDKKAHIALRVIGFLSTLSLRRATPGLVGHRVRIAISIHALLAESDRDQIKCQLVCTTFLSTLSLRRATNIIPIGMCVTASFLSTLSLRRATGILQKGCHELLISIHALLAESDGPDCQGAGPCQNFYPRSPCGERPYYQDKFSIPSDISIHALLAESDGGFGAGNWLRVIFLSTLSLRRATAFIHSKHS